MTFSERNNNNQNRQLFNNRRTLWRFPSSVNEGALMKQRFYVLIDFNTCTLSNRRIVILNLRTCNHVFFEIYERHLMVYN